MAYDWNRNERDGRFDELAAALIFFTIVSLLLASAYLVNEHCRIGRLCCAIGRRRALMGR